MVMMNRHEKFLLSILRFRWLVIILSLVFVIIAAKGLERIVIVTDYKSFIDADYPPLLQLEEIEAIFSENNNLLIAVAPGDGVVFKPETIALIQQMTDRLWLLPHATRVDSITNYQHTDVEGDELIVGDLLLDDEPITALLLERARRVAQNEPTLKHNLISERFDVAVISIIFDVPDDIGANEANEQIILAVNELIDNYRADHADTVFHLTGMLTVDYALGKYGKQDTATLIPGMLALMAVVLLVMTRSLSGIVSAAAVVIFTGIGTMGLLGWTGWIIDPGSAISPIVIMTLAVADSIHVIEGMQHAMRQGMAKQQAIRQSLKDNFLPVFLTSLTTVMGVITFTFAELPSLRRLGLTVAVGVTIAFFLSVTLLPAMLSVLPMKVKPKRAGSTIFNRIAEVSIHHYRIIIVAAVTISVLLISLIPLNKFNDSPSAMVATYTVERKAVDFFEDNVSGIIKVDVVIFSDIPGGVNDPEYLVTVDKFVDWLRDRSSVDHVTTLTDTFKRLNQNMHDNDPAWYRLPEQQDLAAQYLLLYEMSLPYGLDLNNQLNIDKSAIRLTLILGRSDSQQIVETRWAIEEWFAANAADLRVAVTGTTPMIAELSYVQMIPSMMKGGVIAILMVSLVLFVALRSLKLGFMGMLANILPVSMGYGIWYLIDGQVNFVVASVAGVCLGVVVDFAVHFLTKYQLARNAGSASEDAIRFAFAKTGRPLWTTMVVLVMGFWLLMLSPITMNFSMGYLTGIVILLALIFDFFVLPALLMAFDRTTSVVVSPHISEAQAAAAGK